MARLRGFNNRFNAGELSTEAWCDSDLQQHAHGCAVARNFVGLVAGPLARRAGTWDIAAAFSQVKRSRLIPFKRTADQALMLEFGDGQVRVFEADGTLVTQFASPFGEAQLAGIRPTQPPGDVMILNHVDTLIRPKVLTRTAATTWAFDDYDIRNGPWRTENLTTTTITPTGTVTVGGAVALAASANVFEPGHVGAIFKLRENDGAPPWPAWVANVDFDETVNTHCVSNGRVYLYAGLYGTNTQTIFGTSQPIHLSGTVSDGKLRWTYVHDGAGIVQIDNVISPTSATGVVLARLPMASAVATAFWSEGAWSDYRGWPTALPTIHDERLAMAGNVSQPDTLDLTRLAGYTPTYADFKPGLGTGAVVDDDAVRRLAGTEAARIVWLASATYLIAGTTAGAVLVTGANAEDGITPTSYRARLIDDFGCDDVAPTKAHGSVLYVAANGKTLRRIAVAPDQTLASADLSVVAGDICDRGLAEIAWTRQPDNLCWARLDDGGLAAFLFHAEQEVKGWYSQELGGAWSVESIAVMPGYQGRDVLWLIASRTKAGSTQRRILMLSDRADKLRLDSARLYEGAATGSVSGLLHLANEDALAMVANSEGEWTQYTVAVTAGGVAALPAGITGTTIRVGLAYTSRFETLPLDVSGPGSVQGRKARLVEAGVVLTGVSCRVGITGEEGDRLDPIQVGRQPGETTAITEKREVRRVPLSDDSSREPRLVVETSGGYDLMVAVVMPMVDVHG